MREYEFTLKCRLPKQETDPEMYLAALAASDCDDALVGVGLNGRIALDFARIAPSAIEAVSSALENVHDAIPDATLIEATPDYVGLTDIAELLGFSRQYMRKLVERAGNEFPEPVHEGKPTLWHLTEVLDWFELKENREIDPAMFEVSRLNMQLNLFKAFAKASAFRQDGFRFRAEAPSKSLQRMFELSRIGRRQHDRGRQ